MSKSSRRTGRAGSQASGSGASQAGGANPPTGDPTSPARRSVRPARPTARAGRRERARPFAEPTLFEQYRILIVGGVVVAVVALVMVFAFSSAAQPTYACSVPFAPGTTPSPAPGESPQPGYVQDDMGNRHVGSREVVTYTLCPPASGSHFEPPNGPIDSRVYGPGETALPQGWIHNLEHGGLVILYRGLEGDEATTEASQQVLRDFYANMPASPICKFPANQESAGVIIAQFDEMATPYAALVWGRVLPLQAFDADAIMEFWNTFGERTNPEKFCEVPTGSPDASPAAS